MNILTIFFAVIVAASLSTCVSSLKCWTCENARSPKHCKTIGQVKQCRFTEKSCQTEVRKSEGYRTMIRTGCKETHACGNNQIQNPRLAWLPTQCNGDTMNSVCRCCCQTNNCNKRNLLCSKSATTKGPVEMPPPGITTENPKSDQPNTPSPAPMIEPTCKNMPDIPSNGERICTGSGRGEHGTECLFSCDYGYKLDGTLSTVCDYRKDDLEWTHKSPKCVQELPFCPDLGDLPHGEIVCTATGNKLGTVCGFQCLDKGYELHPSDIMMIECIKVKDEIKWSHKKPHCSLAEKVIEMPPTSSPTKKSKYDQPETSSPAPFIEPTCGNLPETPKYGERVCSGSGDGELGTECLFSCEFGYTLEGSLSTHCENRNGKPEWTHGTPSCVQELPFCPELGSFPHGEMVCTDTGNKLGTVCGFQCLDEGYDLRSTDPMTIQCIMDKGEIKWSHRKPCCSSQCPGMAKKDVVIVMDSSSSISRPEWQRMKEFVANVTGKFTVSNEGVHFAIYRFFRRVDTKHQVHFGEFENDNEGLEDAVLNLPKRGGGTYIGRALRHARDNVLTNGNRDDVKDLVWILTDGRSGDSTEEVAQDLRNAGVEIMALGISRKGKDVFEDELVRIAGDKANVLEVKNGMKSLTEDLVDRIVRKICETSCEI